MCSKPKGYATEHEAQVALVSAIIAKNRGKNQRRERRYYYCDGCRRWVLTSMTKAEYESSRLTRPASDTLAEDERENNGAHA